VAGRKLPILCADDVLPVAGCLEGPSADVAAGRP